MQSITPEKKTLTEAGGNMKVRMFRTWPATYRWRGIVEIGAEPVMSGGWSAIRVGSYPKVQHFT